jgi:hypothetical protein
VWATFSWRRPGDGDIGGRAPTSFFFPCTCVAECSAVATRMMAEVVEEAAPVWARASCIGEYEQSVSVLRKQLEDCLDGVTLTWLCADSGGGSGRVDTRVLMLVRRVADVCIVQSALRENFSDEVEIGVETLKDDTTAWWWLWQMEQDIRAGGVGFARPVPLYPLEGQL